MNNVFKAMNPNLIDQVSLLRQNPMAFLLQHRLNIPPEYANDPESAIHHMLNSGQISERQLEDAKNYARSLGINI